MPASASPSEAPTMLASASGVSTTRSEPNFSMSPLVVRNTPPSLPTSRPSTITRGSACISSASALLMASTTLSCGMPLAARELGALPGHAWRRVLVHVGEDVIRHGRLRLRGELQGAVVLFAQLLGPRLFLLHIPQPDRGQVLLHALDRVASLRLLVVLRVLVARGVVGRVVKAHAVGRCLDEARPATLASLVDRGARRRVHRHHVVAVDLDAVEAIPGRPQREAASRGLHAP